VCHYRSPSPAAGSTLGGLVLWELCHEPPLSARLARAHSANPDSREDAAPPVGSSTQTMTTGLPPSLIQWRSISPDIATLLCGLAGKPPPLLEQSTSHCFFPNVNRTKLLPCSAQVASAIVRRVVPFLLRHNTCQSSSYVNSFDRKAWMSQHQAIPKSEFYVANSAIIRQVYALQVAIVLKPFALPPESALGYVDTVPTISSRFFPGSLRFACTGTLSQ